MLMRDRNLRAGLTLLVATVAGACGGADTTTPTVPETTAAAIATTTTAAPPYDVTEVTREYVDTTRPTDDPNGGHSAPARTLVTSIRIPDAPGPFPLVVFAHGNSGHPRKVTQLLDAWARAGYVVAAPVFPLTNDDIDPTVIADYVQQPADLSHVIDGVLADNDADAGPLAGKVDGYEIALAGHSLGGASVYGAAANTCCQGDRVDAVIELSGFRLDFPGGTFLPTDDLPLLAMHGSADPTIVLAMGRTAYDAWTAPKWFVTLEGAPHSPQYEDPPSPHDQLVVDVTTLFLDRILRDDEAAAAQLQAYAPPPDLARIESAP